MLKLLEHINKTSISEFEYALRVGDGQVSLVCCSPWGCRESDTTERQQQQSYRKLKTHPDMQDSGYRIFREARTPHTPTMAAFGPLSYSFVSSMASVFNNARRWGWIIS